MVYSNKGDSTFGAIAGITLGALPFTCEMEIVRNIGKTHTTLINVPTRSAKSPRLAFKTVNAFVGVSRLPRSPLLDLGLKTDDLFLGCRELQFEFSRLKLGISKSRVQISNDHLEISVTNLFG